MPRIVELTMVRKDLSSPVDCSDSIYHSLDRQVCKAKPEMTADAFFLTNKKGRALPSFMPADMVTCEKGSGIAHAASAKRNKGPGGGPRSFDQVKQR